MAADGRGGGLVQPLGADGSPAGEPVRVTDLAAAVRERSRPDQVVDRSANPAADPAFDPAADRAVDPVRWVWPGTSEYYPPLLRAGARVDRCHDLALTEALLLGHAGQWGAPRSLAAAVARLRGEPVPADPPTRSADPLSARQPALFDADRPDPIDPAAELAAVVAVHAAQLAALARTGQPDRIGLLVAAESAGALTAVELAAVGLPWRADVHDTLLRDLLGPRPPAGTLPRRLRELADQIAAAFGGRRVNPDSAAEVVRALTADGRPVASARLSVLRGVDHPAVPLLLAYKELSRLHAAYGWAWLDSWVANGRFHAEYVAGGVVSGRWATRGGGALQIPHAVRGAVVADPGWVLVVADAGQLEPRVLAARSGDRGMAAAARHGDLYAALAAEAFGGDRARAKIAVLSAMYGATGGEAAPLLAVLRRRFPAALEYVEAAARAGEEGRLVRSALGRTCPPPSVGWREQHDRGGDPDADADEWRQAQQSARDRGRFTRNFVIQASAADWALVLLAVLRRRLAGLPWSDPAGRPELVFFLHDEVMVHCPAALAEAVVAAVRAAADEASRLVFPDTGVRFPVEVAVAASYADAK